LIIIAVLGISLVLALRYIRFHRPEYKLFEKTHKYNEVERKILFKAKSELKLNESKTDFSIISGQKNLLVIEENSKMIFAVIEDTIPSDISKDLILLEFNEKDSLISSKNHQYKKAYRKFRGKFSEIDSSEVFEIKKIKNNIYSLYFDLYDFKFNSIIDFNKSEEFIEKIKR
jgi:hypothetical protein